MNRRFFGFALVKQDFIDILSIWLHPHSITGVLHPQGNFLIMRHILEGEGSIKYRMKFFASLNPNFKAFVCKMLHSRAR